MFRKRSCFRSCPAFKPLFPTSLWIDVLVFALAIKRNGVRAPLDSFMVCGITIFV